MEQALAICVVHLCLFVHDTTMTSPPHLNDLAVLDEDRDGALSIREFPHASARHRIDFDVVLYKVTALPLEPLAHLAGVGAASRSIEFKPGHASIPPTIRG
jgi:hypothetical protein